MIRITIEKSTGENRGEYTKYGFVAENDTERGQILAQVETTLRLLQEGEQ